MIGPSLLILSCVAYATWTDAPSLVRRFSLAFARSLAVAGVVSLLFNHVGEPPFAVALAVEMIGIGLLVRRVRVEVVVTPTVAAALLLGNLFEAEGSASLLQFFAAAPAAMALLAMVSVGVRHFEQAQFDALSEPNLPVDRSPAWGLAKQQEAS